MTHSNIENIVITLQGKVFNTMREIVYMFYLFITKGKNEDF